MLMKINSLLLIILSQNNFDSVLSILSNCFPANFQDFYVCPLILLIRESFARVWMFSLQFLLLSKITERKRDKVIHVRIISTVIVSLLLIFERDSFFLITSDNYSNRFIATTKNDDENKSMEIVAEFSFYTSHM